MVLISSSSLLPKLREGKREYHTFPSWKEINRSLLGERGLTEEKGTIKRQKKGQGTKKGMRRREYLTLKIRGMDVKEEHRILEVRN